MATFEKRTYRNEKTGKTIKRYKAKIRLKGFAYEEATFDRKSDAEEWAANREYELRNRQLFGTQTYKTKTVQDLLQRYQDSLKVTNPKRYKTSLPIIKVWEARVGKLKIGDLTKDIIIEERDKLKNRHVKDDPDRPIVSNAAVNRMVAVLRRALNLAVNEWGWLAYMDRVNGIVMAKLHQNLNFQTPIRVSDELESQSPSFEARDYPSVIKYMGSKAKILGFLSDGLNELDAAGLPILDLFAGSCAISGGFGDRHRIISNDIQSYSKVIASCYLRPASKLGSYDLVKMATPLVKKTLARLPEGLDYPAECSLREFNKIDKKNRELIDFDFSSKYHLFTKNYSGTWWSAEQCAWIDALRQALDELFSARKITEADFDLGLTSLMHAMAYSSQGTGHYAQYRDAKTESSKRDINIYRQKSLPYLFAKKLKSLYEWNLKNVSDLGHELHALDYKECLSVSPKSIVYADPPYAFVHYSRFYHAMETIVKYDYPNLQHKGETIVKGRYRDDRHQSPFCIRTKVSDAFSELFYGIKFKKSHLILSYSNTGMIDLDDLTSLAEKELGRGYSVWSEIIDYNHMTMGRREDRSREVQEAIIIAQKN